MIPDAITRHLVVFLMASVITTDNDDNLSTDFVRMYVVTAPADWRQCQCTFSYEWGVGKDAPVATATVS